MRRQAPHCDKISLHCKDDKMIRQIFWGLVQTPPIMVYEQMTITSKTLFTLTILDFLAPLHETRAQFVAGNRDKRTTTGAVYYD
jgi:hypothetical protein